MRSVRVRHPAASDRAALEAMFARCTTATRYARFHGHTHAIPERYLAEALSGSPAHVAIIACADSRTVVALASCRTVAAGTAELGILVEDSAQRQGIGRLLLRQLASHARRHGLTTPKAAVLHHQAWIIRLLREHGTCEAKTGREVLDITLRLDPQKRDQRKDDEMEPSEHLHAVGAAIER